MGDRIDNIVGIHGIGEKKSEKILKDCTTEQEFYDKCVEMYEGDEDRVIENGRMLWLRRYEGQVWSFKSEK
jgi:5'-3' exonuclease